MLFFRFLQEPVEVAPEALRMNAGRMNTVILLTNSVMGVLMDGRIQ